MTNNGAIHGDTKPSYIAGAALANRYRLVKLGTIRNTVVLATAVTDAAIGINQDTSLINDHVAVKTGGRSLAFVGTG